MNQTIKAILFILTILLPIEITAQTSSEIIDWEKKCMFDNKVKSRITYHIKEAKDTINSKWRKTDYDEFDKFGNWICWRQFDVSDTTKFYDREYLYKNDQFIKMTDNYEDGTSTIDSSGYGMLSYPNYRKIYRSSGEIMLEAFIEQTLNNNKKPIQTIIKDKEGNIQARTTISYEKNGKIGEETTAEPDGTIVSKTLYKYYNSGIIMNITTTNNSNQPYETKTFDSKGKITEEVKYDEERPGQIQYKDIFKYDQRGREIEKITYSNIIKLKPSRLETTAYTNNCLKQKTKIYSINEFTNDKVVHTIIRYKYQFH